MFRKQWFLVALVCLLSVGMTFAPMLRPLSETAVLKWTIVAVTMFLMVLKFSFGDISETLRKPQAAILAAFINSALMPLTVWPFVGLVGMEIGAGMVATFAAPCTLVSAAVWTRRAGGDDRVAILVTLITNLLCFLTTPFWVWLMVNAENESTIRFGATVTKLLSFVVLPILVAQLARLNPQVTTWADQNKTRLGLSSQIGILSIVFLGAIQSGIRIRESNQDFPATELVCGVAGLLLLHVAILYVGRFVAAAIGMSQEEQIAVAFAGSQKTLMVGLSIAVSLGITILPMLAFHSIQLVIDTFIADRMRAATTIEEK